MMCRCVEWISVDSDLIVKQYINYIVKVSIPLGGLTEEGPKTNMNISKVETPASSHI